MATTQNKIQFFCFNCGVFIINQEQHKAHCTACPSPNIQCVALIPQPPATEDADKGRKGEKVALPWPAMNVGQIINADQTMSASQVVNAGQIMNVRQVINAGQVMNASVVMNTGQLIKDNTKKAPGDKNSQNTGKNNSDIRIYGNQLVTINNFYR